MGQGSERPVDASQVSRPELRRAGGRQPEDTVAALRGVRGSGWSDIKDPLAELEDMRRDDESGLH